MIRSRKKKKQPIGKNRMTTTNDKHNETNALNRYNALYNPVMYRAVCELIALESSNIQEYDRTVNILISATLEHCGHTRYTGYTLRLAMMLSSASQYLLDCVSDWLDRFNVNTFYTVLVDNQVIGAKLGAFEYNQNNKKWCAKVVSDTVCPGDGTVYQHEQNKYVWLA